MEERAYNKSGFSDDDVTEARELSRRERERYMRRQLMLSAARAVFAEKGYADATLDEIAQRAEFGKGTLYNYFEGGKQEILYAVFDDLHDELYGIIDRTFNPSLLEERPFREVFETFLCALLGFFLDRQDQFMIMMKEGHRMNFNEEPSTAAYFQKQGERLVGAIAPTLEAAAEKGLLRNFPVCSIAHMIVGNVKGYHMHMHMARCRGALYSEPAMSIKDGLHPSADGEPAFQMPTPEESAHFLTSFLLDGLLAQS